MLRALSPARDASPRYGSLATKDVILARLRVTWRLGVSAMPTFGEKLRALRKHRGLSQDHLAMFLGYADRSQIVLLEQGRGNPSPDVVLKLSVLFGVTADQLTRDELDVDSGFTASEGEGRG